MKQTVKFQADLSNVTKPIVYKNEKLVKLIVLTVFNETFCIPEHKMQQHTPEFNKKRHLLYNKFMKHIITRH